MTTHNLQLTVDIRAYVQKFGPCSFADLSAAFLVPPATRDHSEQLRLRLKRMTEDGALHATGIRKGRRWATSKGALTASTASYSSPVPTAVRPTSERAMARSPA